DVLVAGYLFGEVAITGVNLVSPMFFAATFISMMIAVGTAHHYSYEMGRFKKEEADSAVGQGLLLAVAASIFILLFTQFEKSRFLKAVTESTDIFSYASAYYTFFPYMLSVFPLFFLLQFLVYADGGGKRCVLASVLQVAVNVPCSLLLSRKMGMAGLSLGTLIGFIASIVAYGSWIVSVHSSIRLRWHFSFKDTFEMLKFSYAHACLPLYIGISRMSLNKFVALRFEDDCLTAMTVLNHLMVIVLVFEGLGQAVDPLLNIYYGERNPDGIRKVMRSAIKVAIIEGIVLGILMFAFADFLPKLYGVHTPDLLNLCSSALRTVAPVMPFIALLYLFVVYYMVTGHLRISLAIAILRNVVFYIGLPLVMGMMFGIEGVWIGVALAYLVTFFLFAGFLRAKYGKSFPLLLEERDIVSKDVILTVDRLMEIRSWAGRECEKRGIASSVKLKIELMLEELGMLIIEKNGLHPPLAEFSICFKRDIKVMIRDDGVIYDVMDPDAGLSFRSMFVAELLQKGT
ncbi:MAG: hypothetical protein II958_01005, partial [Spirochaetia bacterium]|nr:hypothetical protein [Spirochaetia bacterium]